jgi:hypothetical protein
MTAITPLKIPITVNTSQVAPAMKGVEKTVADSAQRISKIRGAITPALGGLGLGQGASMLGGFTQLGGGAGAGAAAGGALALGLAAPYVAANKYFQLMASSSQGASDALLKFNETGQQTYAANSAILRQYANLEQKAKVLATGDQTTLAGNFLSAAQGGMSTTALDRELLVIKEGYKGIAAFLGTLAGGGSFKEAALQEQLTGTMSESEAARLQTEMAKARQANGMNAVDVLVPILGTLKLIKEYL